MTGACGRAFGGRPDVQRQTILAHGRRIVGVDVAGSGLELVECTPVRIASRPLIAGPPRHGRLGGVQRAAPTGWRRIGKTFEDVQVEPSTLAQRHARRERPRRGPDSVHETGPRRKLDDAAVARPAEASDSAKRGSCERHSRALRSPLRSIARQADEQPYGQAVHGQEGSRRPICKRMVRDELARQRVAERADEGRTRHPCRSGSSPAAGARRTTRALMRRHFFLHKRHRRGQIEIVEEGRPESGRPGPTARTAPRQNPGTARTAIASADGRRSHSVGLPWKSACKAVDHPTRGEDAAAHPDERRQGRSRARPLSCVMPFSRISNRVVKLPAP